MITQLLSAKQIKSGRALLSWTRKDLAKETGLSAETIQNIEHDVYSPKKETLTSLVDAFARHGVQFIHYETLIGGSAENSSKDSLKVISYAGAVHVTAFTPEIGKEGHD